MTLGAFMRGSMKLFIEKPHRHYWDHCFPLWNSLLASKVCPDCSRRVYCLSSFFCTLLVSGSRFCSMHKICHCQSCLENCYCWVSFDKNFCLIYPFVAGFGCSCNWNFAVGRIAVVVGVAVAGTQRCLVRWRRCRSPPRR